MDSIEGLGIDDPGRRRDIVTALYRTLADDIVQNLREGIFEVRVGWAEAGTAAPKEWKLSDTIISTPDDYGGK